jgi:ketosteroid isomerase-like protein
MRTIVLVFIVLAGLAAPAAAQRAAIDAANAKWMDSFNKGDFDGVASLYAADATAFPPGSPW